VTLRDLMARHARTTLTRPDHFGESAVYLFKAGGTRTVRCVVDRLDVEPSAPNVPQVARLRAVVAIPRDATDGIETHTSGDKMQLAMRLGAAAVTVRIKRIISQDEGMFLLELEA
jgi:hypothetical protein